MKSKMIPAEEIFIEWRKEPGYRDASEALNAEFAVASALIEAESRQTSTRLSAGPTKPKR